MGFIDLLKRLFVSDKRTTSTQLPDIEIIFAPAQKEFPKAKRYIIHTAEGGKFCCKGQKAVADTLEALYNCGIDRNRIHNAMMHHKGRIVIDNKYIATVKYKKEK